MQKSNHYPAWYGCFPDRGRLTCHWLSSHKTLESFIADHGESSSWQWHANQAADALCGKRALEVFSQEPRLGLPEQTSFAWKSIVFLQLGLKRS